MSSISIEQYEYLMTLQKRFVEDITLDLNKPWSQELVSLDERESFILDYTRGQVEFKKMSLNKRYRSNIVLARLCTLKRHTNPDGTVFPDAHVHLYDEMHGNAIAYPISHIGLSQPFTHEEAFEKFSIYCKITSPRLQTVIGA